MPTKLDVGGIVYQYGIGVATLSVTPLFDRAMLLKRINLSQVSAKDNWTLTIGGRAVATFRQSTVGNQQLLTACPPGSAPNTDFFTLLRNVYGIDVTFPIPLGLTATLASAGGATADIEMEMIEVDASDAGTLAVNHFLGKHFIIPITWYNNTAIPAAAGGVVQADTQVAPAWFPALFAGAQVPAGWVIKMLALFAEGVGVNTFSGAADHQSTTQDWRLTKNGTLLFSRTTNGIPNRGKAAAAGSANTVFGQRSGVFPPITLASFDDENKLQVPITLREGDNLVIQQEIQGDTTGTAAYLDSLLTAFCDITVPTGAGSLS
jgi:hypothetical protein